MKDLTITDILGIDEQTVVEHPIKEWNGIVYLKVMGADERSELEDLFMKIRGQNKGSGLFRKELLKRVLCDRKGENLLPDDAHATQFMKKNSLVIEQIFEHACELNGFREKDVDTLKKK